MNARRWSVVVAVLIVAVGAGWWAWSKPAVDPHMARVDELGKKLADLPMEEGSMPKAREIMGEIRDEMRQLTPEQRREMMQKGPPPFMRMVQKRIDQYFDLPAEERQDYLDKEIDTMERMRKQFAERRQRDGEGGGPPGGGPRPNFGGEGFSPERRREMQQTMLNNTSSEQRARFSQYMHDVQERRRQRGMPEMFGPRF